MRRMLLLAVFLVAVWRALDYIGELFEFEASLEEWERPFSPEA